MDGWPARRWLLRCGRYRTAIYLLLGLVAVDVAVARGRKTWTRYDPNEYRARVTNCRRQGWDLVVIGGSLASEGVDPSHLAGIAWHGVPLKRVFNLGLPGGTTTTAWHAVKHGVIAPPRVLLYPISASDLNDNRSEIGCMWSLVDPSDVAEWLRVRPDQAESYVRHCAEERLTRLWSLYYYRNAIRLWTADQVEQLRPGSCPAAAAEARHGLAWAAALARPDGFAPRWFGQTLSERKARGPLDASFPFLEGYRLGGQVQYLQRILDWADSHGVAVVLLDMPVAAELEAAYRPAFAGFRQVLAQVERERSVTVLRPTREQIGLDDTGFADRVHLNTHGRELMGAWLRARLAS